jgi:hypothetical protein
MWTSALVRMSFGLKPGFHEIAGQRHRVAAGMGRGEQLFRVGAAAV